MLGTPEGTSKKLPGTYQKEEARRNPAALNNDQDKIETDQTYIAVPAAKPCTSSRSINIIGGNIEP